MSLIIALKNGLYTSPQKYCLLTIGINTVAMIKNLEQNFKICGNFKICAPDHKIDMLRVVT